ncbi:MAG: hypothetical protein IJS81_00720 [Selenomonadaceae bacterium]|nr:hypothetical protein [Selenomonadaceae bacterium]
MLKKIFIALIFGLIIFSIGIIFLFPYINVCNGKMPRSEMYLGGLTIGEVKKVYGDEILINYDSYEKIQSIIVKGGDWTTPSGFNVGGNIRTVLNAYGSADFSKSNDSKKVYFYFHCENKKPAMGLAILIDESNGEILELGIYGDTADKKFSDSYEDIAEKILMR